MTTSKRGPLVLILFAALMAGAGNGISIVAFPWLVLQRNGSALGASIVAMAGTLPLLVATVIAGAAVDYLGRRRVSMTSDFLSALSVATVPVLALMFGVDAVNVGVLAGLAALGAFFDPAGMTARETMLPEAAGRRLDAGPRQQRLRWRSWIWPPPACTCRWRACCFRSTSPTAMSPRSWAGC